MGSVWVAQQTEPVRRKVAVKLIKLGMDSKQVLTRFHAERQALALMDHPHIAKVFDGGITEQGRSYFVMEYVKGIPIIEYCDQARLTIRQRLALFVQICQAVQHAHQKGIIHRDLKPSNILVCLYDGQPVPKVIDFGLAKAMHQSLTEQSVYTGHGMMVGTPLYMSPEQAEFNNLDIDTRSDIYSLGVVLYELLTGSTPLERQQLKDAVLNEVLRLIKEAEPPKPSTRVSSSASLPSIAAQRGIDPGQLGRSIRGDLDWIVMKALEKERSRRYETANGLARDIDRYLNDEAVEACPPSAAYRWTKFARRYRLAIRTAAAFLTLLVVATVISGWSAIRARRAESTARSLLATAEEQTRLAQASEAKAKQLAISEQAAKEEQTRQREAAEIANARTLEALRSFTDELMENLIASRTQFSPQEIAILNKALAQWNAFAQASGTSEQASLIQAEGLYRVGNLQLTLGRVDDARKSTTKALALIETFYKAKPDNASVLHLRCMANHVLMCVETHHDNQTKVIQLCRQVTRDLEHLCGIDPGNVEYKSHLAQAKRALYIQSQGRIPSADREQIVREAMSLFEQVASAADATLHDRINLANCYHDLGVLEIQQGAIASAREHLTKSLAAKLESAKDFPDDPELLYYTHLPLYNLGTLEWMEGHLDQYLDYRQRSYEVLLRAVKTAPGMLKHRLKLLKAGHELANQLLELEKQQETLQCLTQTLAFADAPTDEPSVVRQFTHWRIKLESTRAWALFELGKTGEALKQVNHLIKQRRQVESLDLYNFACLYSMASAVQKDQQDEYRRRAVRILHYALTAGFSDANHLRVDPDLDALRDRHDFQELLQLVTQQVADVAAAQQAAQAGAWNSARERYQQLIERAPGEHTFWYKLAHILAVTGDREAYARHCQAMADEFGETVDPSIAERTAKAISLLPDVRINPALATRLAEFAVTETKGATYYRYYLLCRALTAYRQDDLETGDQYAQLAIEADVEVQWRATTSAYTHLLRAMVAAKRQQEDVALAELRAAKSEIADSIPPLDSGELNVGWVDVVLTHLLLRECRSLFPPSLVAELDTVEFDLSYASKRARQYAKAEELFRQKADRQTDPLLVRQCQFGIAECLLRQGKYHEGVELLGELWKWRFGLTSTIEAQLLREKWDQSGSASKPPNARTAIDGLAFDGASSYVVLPTIVFDGRPPWTFEAIARTANANAAPEGWISLVSAADSGSISLSTNERRWSVELFTAEGAHRDWVQLYSAAKAPDTPGDGVWQHLAGVWDGHELRLYVDGELVAKHDDVDWCTSLAITPVFIGADPTPFDFPVIAHGFLQGNIRSVRISRGAEYTDSFAKIERLENTKDTIGLYDFTEDTGEFAIDQSGHGNHGIIVGAQFSQ
ncbi:MAG: protein kinase [Pirellulales bacterium]